MNFVNSNREISALVVEKAKLNLFWGIVQRLQSFDEEDKSLVIFMGGKQYHQTPD